LETLRKSYGIVEKRGYIRRMDIQSSRLHGRIMYELCSSFPLYITGLLQNAEMISSAYMVLACGHMAVPTIL